MKSGEPTWEPVKPWKIHRPGQVIGECGIASQNEAADPIAAAVCDSEGILGELITDGAFGCNQHAVYTEPADQEDRMNVGKPADVKTNPEPRPTNDFDIPFHSADRLP